MANTSSKKRSTIIPHAWFKSLEKLPDDVAGRIYKAIQLLDITGEMTVFERGSIEDILFSQYAYQTDEFGQNYAATCENRSKAAKEREERKKAQKAQSENLVPQENQFVDDRSGVDRIGKDRIGKDRSGGGKSGEDVSDTTTTTFEDEIVQAWNQHDFVQKIKRVDNPQKRMERTEMAVAVAGGRDSFLNVLRSLDQQAYLKNQPEKGYKVIYDWLVQPDTFQALMEGRYKDNRSKYGDDWEVIDLG